MTINSVPYAPPTYAMSTPDNQDPERFLSIIQTILQTLATCINARSSMLLTPYPYSNGGSVIRSNGQSTIITQYVSLIIPAGGGSTSVPIPALSSQIIPLHIYGCAVQLGSNSVGYPVGYSQGSTFLQAYLNGLSLSISASSTLAGYTATVVLEYVYA